MTRESPKKRSNARQDRMIAELNERNADIIEPLRNTVFAGGGPGHLSAKISGIGGALGGRLGRTAGFTKPMTETKQVTMPRRSIKYEIPQVQLEELRKKIKRRDSFGERAKKAVERAPQVWKETSKFLPTPAQRKDEKK